MDILQLKYFLAAAEYEHITKAAHSLHIAQPALSQSIKHLEEELGVELFERKNRGIHLNACGKLLKSELLPIIDTLDSLPVRLKEVDKEASSTIQLNILAASMLITKSIISFKKLYPEVKFRLLQDADETDFDICISCAASDKIPKDGILLLEEKILLAVPSISKYASLKSISLNQVKEEGFINFSGARPFRIICDDYCKEKGFKPKIIFESDNQECIKNLIASNFGIAFWPQYAWGKLTAKNAVLIPINRPQCTRTIYAIQNQHSTNSKYANAFLKHLIKVIASIQNTSSKVADNK
ncbi:LysR family transcriptional regulator [Clostridium guangxiense]|uniref:LysR family transcriptional regulator n=1 Tax=Clostridium guangxiense TaxID=1662055 RepID=UPI001E3FC376|nr:LysR family transcriptional regulator [Clostridium guangxiense]MCD2347685.1 LysR family transcriptional regulator [Clostridium guangxiense]